MGTALIPSISVPNCPTCRRGSGLVRHVGARDLWFGTPGRWVVRECEHCQGLWLDPRPTSAALPQLYENYYTHGAKVGRRNRSVWARLRSRLPWHDLDVTAALGYLTGMSPGRVLDLGCGDGTRMEALRGAGWSPVGVDLDIQAVEAARRANVGEIMLGTIADVGPPASFDAIVAFHVLEHVEDPLAALRRARELLRPRGILSVATPNATSWLHKRYGDRWRGLEPPRHLQIFSPSGLRRLICEAGFTSVDVFTTARNAGGLAFVSEASYGVDMPRPARLVLQLKSELIQALQWLRLRWQPNCGEELVAIASI